MERENIFRKREMPRGGRNMPEQEENLDVLQELALDPQPNAGSNGSRLLMVQNSPSLWYT
ncbi:MAG TPA: hypothetical protein VMU27_01080 [Candidatus Paceibacterota bacterium]|nr:hypothetical protein [Candidatus Paceibacterota bacterium]